MTTTNKIKKLYNIPAFIDSGFDERELIALETRLNVALPEKLRNYYLTLGKIETLNFLHNRLLKPDNETYFSDDRYLVFYEENQVVAYWGIKEADLVLDNPPVYGNYAPHAAVPDWHLESKTTEDFLLLMAICNGTFGGLNYNANSFELVPPEAVKYIEENYTLVQEISYSGQKIYTDNFEEAISLSFDESGQATAIFTGTSDRNRFDALLEKLSINWSYISDEDENEEEE